MVKNVTVVGFIGDKEESYVIISDKLINDFVSAKKSSNGKHYWYFFLKENSEYKKLSDNIWLSYSEYEKLIKQFGIFGIETDSKIKRKKSQGTFLIKQLVNEDNISDPDI